MTILKILFLFLATIYLVSIAVKLAHKEVVDGVQIVLFAIGFVGFVTVQYLIWKSNDCINSL